MTLLDRVQESLRRRDQAVPITSGRRAGAVVRRRGAGYRRVITVDGLLDPAAVAELVEAIADAIEAGAREVSINLSAAAPKPELKVHDGRPRHLNWPSKSDLIDVADCAP